MGKDRCKKMRREGLDLNLTSGVKPLADKCKIDVLPGMHGQKRGRLTDYGKQLRMKQVLKRAYGILERQFRRYYREAARLKGATGELLLQLLETRLDNAVYRMGFASTRAEARQLVSHGGVTVNGKDVNVPSYQAYAGDKIKLKEKCKNQIRVQAAIQLAQQRAPVEWVKVDFENGEGEVIAIPEQKQLPPEFNPQLVVELYSK